MIVLPPPIKVVGFVVGATVGNYLGRTALHATCSIDLGVPMPRKPGSGHVCSLLEVEILPRPRQEDRHSSARKSGVSTWNDGNAFVGLQGQIEIGAAGQMGLGIPPRVEVAPRARSRKARFNSFLDISHACPGRVAVVDIQEKFDTWIPIVASTRRKIQIFGRSRRQQREVVDFL